MNTVRGGQIFFHSLRMWYQIHATTIKVTLVLSLAVGLYIGYLISPENTYNGAFFYLRNELFNLAKIDHTISVATYWDNKFIHSPLGTQLQSQSLKLAFNEFKLSLKVSLFIGLLLHLILLSIVYRFFTQKGKEKSEDTHIGGFKLTSESKDLSQSIKQNGKKLSPYKIDGAQILPEGFLNVHGSLHGTTGTGKSNLLKKLIPWLLKSDEKIVIYDKGCSLIDKFYNPKTDIILNPMDVRCANWDIWCEGTSATDFENLAKIIIPQSSNADPFWVESARTIFSATAYQMYKNDPNDCSIEKLLDTLLRKSVDELHSLLSDTEAATLTSKSIEKTAISIKGVMATFVKSLRYLEGLDKSSLNVGKQRFSITDWVKDRSRGGVIWITVKESHHTALKPLITTWIGSAIKGVLDSEENPNRSVVCLLDEINSLHHLPDLSRALAEGRKFGLGIFAGLQSYYQLEHIYGQAESKAIWDLFNTRFYYRNPSEQVAKFASSDIGHQRIKVTRESTSYGANEFRDGVSLSTAEERRPVVYQEDLMCLPDLQCYMRTANSEYVLHLHLKLESLVSKVEPFIPRNYQSSEAMKKVETQLDEAILASGFKEDALPTDIPVENKDTIDTDYEPHVLNDEVSKNSLYKPSSPTTDDLDLNDLDQLG